MGINCWTAETKPLTRQEERPIFTLSLRDRTRFLKLLTTQRYKNCSNVFTSSTKTKLTLKFSGRAVHDEVVYLFTLFIFYFFICIGNMGYILIQAPTKQIPKKEKPYTSGFFRLYPSPKSSLLKSSQEWSRRSYNSSFKHTNQTSSRSNTHTHKLKQTQMN